MKRFAFFSRSPEDTEEVGHKLGKLLHKGAFVALQGELGGGKTCFTHGVVAAVAPESAHLVASPTFAIMNHYPGPVPFYHFDFYRLTGEADIADLGLDEYMRGDTICIAEWAERLESLLPHDLLQVTFEHVGEFERRITFEAAGARSEKLLDLLANSCNT